MGNINNATTYMPCVGELIEENCAVGQFADNCLYLFADPESDLAQRAVDIMEQYRQLMDFDPDNYYSSYKLEVVQDAELSNHPKIREHIEQQGDNLLIQLPAFAIDGNAEYKKRFIVADADDDNIFERIHQMVYAAEQIAKSDMDALLRYFEEEDSDSFVGVVYNVITDRNIPFGDLEASSDDTPQPTLRMASSTARVKKQMDIKGEITHRLRMEMYDRLFDNLKKSHKKHDPKMEAEIDYIIKNTYSATLRMFLQDQSPKLQEKIANFINPRHLAETSSMDLKIRWFDEIDRRRRNDGHYRLILCKGDDRLIVHFSRSAAFVLYLIYLMDRKKNGDKVDTLNLVQYKQLFGKLYEMTYCVNGEDIFTEMIKNFDAEGEKKQKSLYMVLETIRDDVGMTCERMQEPAEPFILQDAKAHLTVLPKHIIVPEEIMALI